MKNIYHITASILAGLLIFGIFYLLTVFVQLDFSTAKWSDVARQFTAIAGGGLGIVCSIFCFAYFKTEHNGTK